ncbi:MAG TPA: non-heme iron oxygenase ferredoxin subunit [Mycobacteriales bacterium]|nr:non-heme iron oxygenase ferredoxin subunit [Mycobacteriales bacterium]
MSWGSACPLATLSDAIPLGVVVNGVPVCLVRLGHEVLAVHDECTHEAVPLSEGEVDDHTIECWMHGSRFNLRTGEVLNPPAVKPVATYPTRVVEGQVQVDVAD